MPVSHKRERHLTQSKVGPARIPRPAGRVQQDPAAGQPSHVICYVQLRIGGTQGRSPRCEDPLSRYPVEFRLKILLCRAPLSIAEKRFLLPNTDNDTHT